MEQIEPAIILAMGDGGSPAALNPTDITPPSPKEMIDPLVTLKL